MAAGGIIGQLPHGSAKTTHAVRGELQRSQASVAQLARRFGINEKTMIKWRKRQSVEDLPMGPKERRSSVLSPMEEVAIVALRVQARLSLDEVYIALKDVIPHLARSSLHRCLQRHGISRLPTADREKTKKVKTYEIGYFYIDIAELRYEGGKAFVIHIFERVCLESGIEHWLTKPYHPWTNGQAERMVRMIKEATVKSFHYASINKLRWHVQNWLTAYNFAKQLRALRLKIPYEAIEQLWKAKLDVFIVQPHHHMMELNT